jgi:S-adenosylmethionine hydrolase
MNSRPRIITLLTDFGTQDYFVGAMKGVILSINPAAQIIDITHEIPPQDIYAAAFNLLATYRDFPPGTIHVAVVDPGVGSSRRPITIECAEQYFVGPDNGLFSWICEREGKFRARQLTNEKFFRNPFSSTFHGRDVFAPVAAALSNGVNTGEFGPVIDDLVRLESLKPKTTDKGIEARIIHIDRFGNCITNLTRDLFTRDKPASKPRLDVNGKQVTSFREFFADDASDGDELFVIIGSAGFAEIAARNRSAASMVNARRGQSIFFTTHEDN